MHGNPDGSTHGDEGRLRRVEPPVVIRVAGILAVEFSFGRTVPKSGPVADAYCSFVRAASSGTRFAR